MTNKKTVNIEVPSCDASSAQRCGIKRIGCTPLPLHPTQRQGSETSWHRCSQPGLGIRSGYTQHTPTSDSVVAHYWLAIGSVMGQLQRRKEVLCFCEVEVIWCNKHLNETDDNHGDCDAKHNSGRSALYAHEHHHTRTEFCELPRQSHP